MVLDMSREERPISCSIHCDMKWTIWWERVEKLGFICCRGGNNTHVSGTRHTVRAVGARATGGRREDSFISTVTAGGADRVNNSPLRAGVWRIVGLHNRCLLIPPSH